MVTKQSKGGALSDFVALLALSIPFAHLACSCEEVDIPLDRAKLSPPPVIVVEAENCDVTNGNINRGASSSGDRYVDLQTNGSLECRINAPFLADVEFRIKVPSGPRAMGVFTAHKKLGVISTTSTTWVTQKLENVTLGATLQLRATENSPELDIDMITVVPARSEAPLLFEERFSGHTDGAWTCRQCSDEWNSGPIATDASCTVRVSATIWRDESGVYDRPDSVHLLARVDNGPWKTLFSKIQNVERQTLTIPVTTRGGTLWLKFAAQNSASDEAYYLDNVRVASIGHDGNCGDDQVIEAESCQVENGEFVSTSTASGGRYVDFSSEGRMRCDVDALARRDLVFRVKSPSGNREMNVYVDGRQVGLVWTSSQRWVTRTLHSVDLNGAIEVRDSGTSHELDIDSITVRDATVGAERLPLMLIAYYYTWYPEKTWKRGTPGGTPTFGYYFSGDPEVAETHNDWAVDRGGIDAWAVSWWGQDSSATENLRMGLLRASNLDKINFFIFYESKILRDDDDNIDFANPATMDALLDDVAYIRDNYFDHPSYLRIDGRPILQLYITRRWENFGRAEVEELKAHIGDDVILIADEPFVGRQADVRTAANGLDSTSGSIFEIYSPYNMHVDRLVDPGETATDFMFRVANPIFEHWSERTIFMPHVLPKWNSWKEEQRKMPGTPEQMREQLDAYACLRRPDDLANDFPRMIFVTSFNEWYEGAQVEPDAENRYGFSFLDELKNFKSSPPDCM